MTRVSVDDRISDLNSDNSQKVGEVLRDILDTLPPNRIITKILIDGKQVSQYAPRSPMDETQDGFQELEIRTADREIWALNGLDIVLTAIERVQKSLIRSAELFREDDQKAEANQHFVHCVDGLERFVEALTITRTALKLDFNQIAIEGLKLSQVELEFTQILKAIVECQEKQDFIGVADRVEYELITNLYSWAVLLGQLRISLHSNA